MAAIERSFNARWIIKVVNYYFISIEQVDSVAKVKMAGEVIRKYDGRPLFNVYRISLLALENDKIPQFTPPSADSLVGVHDL